MKKIVFKNLTPHDVVIDNNDGTETIIPAEKISARVASKEVVIGNINGIDIYDTIYGEIENLPDQEEGVIFIISRMVRGRVPERQDLMVPGAQIRNEQGFVVGCKGLALK